MKVTIQAPFSHSRSEFQFGLLGLAQATRQASPIHASPTRIRRKPDLLDRDGRGSPPAALADFGRQSDRERTPRQSPAPRHILLLWSALSRPPAANSANVQGRQETCVICTPCCVSAISTPRSNSTATRWD